MSGTSTRGVAPVSAWTLFVRGLHFSIFTLWGLVFGAGLSVPIVLDYWHFAFGADLTWASAIGLGCYLLAVGFLGTWLSLGLLGEWAGRTGGRPLRLVLQVCGILLTACLTLFCALPVTLLAMVWAGHRQEKRNRWKWAAVFSAMVVMVFAVGVQPALRVQTVKGERAKRGKVLGALIRAKVEDYRAELKERQEQLLCQGDWYSATQCFFDIIVAYCPKALPQGPNQTLLYIRVSCPDGEVIQVVSTGGTKEDDFLSALHVVIRERGWRMEVTRESE